MKKVVVNHPLKKWVGVGWILITVFVVALFAAIFPFVSPEMDAAGNVLFAIFFMAMSALMAGTTLAYYRTTYVIKNKTLYSWSPFIVIDLPLKSILRIEKTKVPNHLRVGASAYCGVFWIPGVGWTRSIITNLGDALLIYAKGGKKYLITPSNPEKFAKLLKR